MLSQNRSKFGRVEKAVAKAFTKLPFSPNAWTGISVLFALATVYFLIYGMLLQASVALLVAAFLDIVDGAVARATGRATKFGAYLDTVVDRYVEGIVIIGLLFVALPAFFVPSAVWIGIYLFGSLMTTYVKAAAKEREIVKGELVGGLLERAERLLILFAGLLLGSFNPLWLVYVIAILAILTNATALQKASMALRLARKI